MQFGRIRAFFSGIFNARASYQLKAIVAQFSPDIVFVQNLFPLISPAALPFLGRLHLPIIMRVANYRLICPNGLLFSHGQICDRCEHSGEHWCILRNCEGSLPKSVGYAIRTAVARQMGLYKENVDAYISASRFLKDRLSRCGFSSEKINVIPNVVHDESIGVKAHNNFDPYVIYVGRLSQEKGIHTILKAAELCPEIPFRFVGALRDHFQLPAYIPSNVTIAGPEYDRQHLAKLYAGARLTVSASECFETFGMSIAEAMLHRLPVVAPRHGVFPDLVQDEITGLLFDPGKASDLAQAIRKLWRAPDVCVSMGAYGRARVLERCSPAIYYSKLMDVCNRIIR